MLILKPTTGDKTISIIPRSMDISGVISLRVRRDGDGSKEEVVPLSVIRLVNYIEIIFPNDNGLLKEDSTYYLEVIKDEELWYRDKIYVTSQSKSDMALNSHQIGNGSIYKPYNELDDNTYIITDAPSTIGSTVVSTVVSTGGTTTQNNPPTLRWNFNEPLDIAIDSVFSYQIRAWYSPTSITIENIPEGLSCSPSGLISGIAIGEDRVEDITIVMINSYGETRNVVQVNLSDSLPLTNPLRAEFSYVSSAAIGNDFNSRDGVHFAYNASGNQFNSEISFPEDGSPMVLLRPNRINYIRKGIPFSFIFSAMVNLDSEHPVTNSYVNRVIDGLVFLHRYNQVIGIVTGEDRTETIDFTVENELGSTTQTFEFKIIEDEGTENAYPLENLADNGSSQIYLRLKWDNRFYNGSRVWKFVNFYMNGEFYTQKDYSPNANTQMLQSVIGFNEVQVSYVDTDGLETELSPEGVFLKMKGQGHKPEIITDSDRVYYAQRNAYFQLDIETDIEAFSKYSQIIDNGFDLPIIKLDKPISGTTHSLQGQVDGSNSMVEGNQWSIRMQFIGDDSRGSFKVFTLQITNLNPNVLNKPTDMGYIVDSNDVVELSWIEGHYNGTISETQLYQDDILVRRVFNNELNYSIQGLDNGTHVFKTRHKDILGNFSEYSDSLTVNI
ncbi:MAG: Uncharacterised protein [Cryomorphaceae bacterium]|nr:MAG: Uncharacterised protein [Cryomorphaceae bacterium]